MIECYHYPVGQILGFNTWQQYVFDNTGESLVKYFTPCKCLAYRCTVLRVSQYRNSIAVMVKEILCIKRTSLKIFYGFSVIVQEIPL